MARCKNCKDKFEVKYFNQKFCMIKDECIKSHSETSKTAAWKKRKAKLKTDLVTVQQLTKTAQVVFNRFIRLRDYGKKCISCPTVLGAVKYDAGHYFNANNHKNICFSEKNVFGQCVKCNQHLHGNLISYQLGIQKRIGAADLLELHQIAHETRKFTREELNEIITKYKVKIKELE